MLGKFLLTLAVSYILHILCRKRLYFRPCENEDQVHVELPAVNTLTSSISATWMDEKSL